MTPVKQSDRMDKISSVWLCIGDKLRNRPMAILAFVCGLAIFISMLVYSTINTTLTAEDLEQLQEQLCAENQQSCSQLLDRLLKNPTDSQKERLKEIIKDAN